jgi:hypothetical protein
VSSSRAPRRIANPRIGRPGIGSNGSAPIASRSASSSRSTSPSPNSDMNMCPFTTADG